MVCPYCGCACVDGRYAAAQQQALAAAQQQAFAHLPLQQDLLGLLNSYSNAQLTPVEQFRQALRFFEDNPQLSGWQESAKEWSKIP